MLVYYDLIETFFCQLLGQKVIRVFDYSVEEPFYVIGAYDLFKFA